MTFEVHALDVGDLELDASFVNWQSDCGVKNWYPTTAWLILGTEKPILIDSSFRSVEDAKLCQGLVARRSPQQSLESQLGKHGVALSQVGLLIHTHVHMDHAGQDSLLPNARILVQREELQNAAAPDMYPVPFYDRQNIAKLIDPLWHRVEILDGECEPLPGIRCVPMPGHTPGHQAIYVRGNAGNIIICGDAAMNVSVNVNQQIPPGFLDDMADTMRGLRRLRAEGAYVLPTHDPDALVKYVHGVR